MRLALVAESATGLPGQQRAARTLSYILRVGYFAVPCSPVFKLRRHSVPCFICRTTSQVGGDPGHVCTADQAC